MAYTIINKSTDHFNTKLYTADQQANRVISGVGFQPDFVWLKNRNQAVNHDLYDAVRGATKSLASNSSGAETNQPDGLIAFNSDGFTVDTSWGNYATGNDYASWNWKANGQGSSNTDGSINTTYTSANTTAGFSISSYTGTGSNATVGHGLGTTPKMILIKNLTATGWSWRVYHNSVGATKRMGLDTTSTPITDATAFNNTAPTSSVFSVGTSVGANGSGNGMIAYCFAEKQGYSKFGGYTGNDNADGTFVYTGFKPAFVMIKRTDDNDNWYIYDNKRDGYNVDNNDLHPNNTDTESTDDKIDLLSNGFKLRAANNDVNGNNDTYVYMAIGQSLVGSNNVPCTAR